MTHNKRSGPSFFGMPVDGIGRGTNQFGEFNMRVNLETRKTTVRSTLGRLSRPWVLVFAGLAGSPTPGYSSFMVLCPDMMPGPPDCFDCQTFGDASAVDPWPYVDWTAWVPMFLFNWPAGGSFAVSAGYHLFTNHYTCAWSSGTETVVVRANVQYTTYGYADSDAWTYVTCSTVT